MCLILVAWRAHPAFPVVVAANRDEFFHRPTACASFWPDAPGLLAGRDLEAGGTWLGVTRRGRFCALTNFRGPSRQKAGAPSRGALVRDFLGGDVSPAAYASRVVEGGVAYNGFNLLCADAETLCYASNVSGEALVLPAGIYGLSNHLLDTPWPKVARAKSALARSLAALPDDSGLFALLRDDHPAADEDLPRTGISLEWERLLSSALVRGVDYGTRSSTVVLMRSDGETRFDEISYGPDARDTGRVRESFRREPPPATCAS
ncbi:MAG: NRDE family protein [Betaproteobacteria bacterium]|nr:NRDE family protein [Betaproteobacteria bacterium]